MKMEELISEYPKSTRILKKWFTEKLVKSLSSLQNASDEFVQEMEQLEMTDKILLSLIANNPHSLFEVFDTYNIHISISVKYESVDKTLFSYEIVPQTVNKKFKSEWVDSRKEAERNAIEEAFELLEIKLQK